MKLLDVFCGGGGAAMGYSQAGFSDITGVDIAPQPRYPFRFVQADALTYLAAHGAEYDVIHASPPCQGYSVLRHLPWMRDKPYPLLIAPLLTYFRSFPGVWVLENVEAAPLDGAVLCGTMFGLPLYRHRRFASNLLFLTPDHPRHVHVISYGRRSLAQRYRQGEGGNVTGVWAGKAADVMGIDWMTPKELSQAIPPAYTQWIGAHIRTHLPGRRRPA